MGFRVMLAKQIVVLYIIIYSTYIIDELFNFIRVKKSVNRFWDS